MGPRGSPRDENDSHLHRGPIRARCAFVKRFLSRAARLFKHKHMTTRYNKRWHMGAGHDKLGVDLNKGYTHEKEKISARGPTRYDDNGRYAAVGVARIPNI